jgi:hypothetical protein
VIANWRDDPMLRMCVEHLEKWERDLDQEAEAVGEGADGEKYTFASIVVAGIRANLICAAAGLIPPEKLT